MNHPSILFDHQIFQSQKYGGISRYFAEILPRLTEEPELDVSLFLGRSINEYGLENKKSIFKNFRGSKSSTRISSKLNRIEFPLYSSFIRPDITHFTYYRDTNPFFKGYRVVTVYDMIHEIFPTQFAKDDATAEWKKQGVAKADLIISISESTKLDLMKYLHVPEEKIKISYLANSLFVEPKSTAPLARPYLLFVGLRGGYKNFKALVRAMSLSQNGKDLDLLAFGGPPFSREELALIKECGFEGRVHHRTGGDLELATAYKHAKAFVFPSVYEGFGIPPLEAMQYGCPVISSNVSSVPEIVGDGGLQVQADQPEEMARAIEKIIGDDSFRNGLIQKGFLRTKQFSWDRCALEHRDHYLKA